MEKKLQSIFVILIFLILSVPFFAQTIPTDSLYLGQTPPGNTPIIFNLSVSSGLHSCERIAITSDGAQIFYGELNTYPPSNQRIKTYQYNNNKWEGPFTVFEGYNSPRLSPNDSTIYIQKHQNGMSYTYYSEKTADGWSTPKKFYSKDQQTHYLQKTGLNNYYVSTNLSGGFARDICKLIITDSDTVFQSLGNAINTSYDEPDFFMAEDESYIIFSRQTGATDTYISFKDNKGKWTDPIKFEAPINKPDPNWEYGQFISPDGKYLFFTRGGTSMSSYYTYWVRIDNIIDSLRNTIVGVENTNAEHPENFRLYQNYPNPFNPSTNISYSVYNTCNVVITIYDQLGRELETLIDQIHKPGNYKINYLARNLSSGAYFYRIKAGDYVDTKRMLLLK